MEYNRRKFIRFLGKASLGTVIMPQFLISCGNITTPTKGFGTESEKRLKELKNIVLKGIIPSDKDNLILANNLNYHTIIKWGDKISDTDSFGFNNDFTCFIPFDYDNPKDGLLWVNHEYVNPLFVSGFDGDKYEKTSEYRTTEQVNKEMYNVGGSIVRIKEENGVWKVVKK